MPKGIFGNNKVSEHGTNSYYNYHKCRCDACRKAHAETNRSYNLTWARQHKEEQRQYQMAHQEHIRHVLRQWKQINPGKYNSYRAKRRAITLQAIPKWLTKEQLEQMKQFYMNRPEGYHVDHIYPLQGEGSCGLHVPWNLQYLPASENLSKGNRL
jgi:hypothetical protein